MIERGGIAKSTRRTTLWGGFGVAASALLLLVIGLPFATVNGVTALSWYVVPSGVAAVVSLVAALLLASAVSCLAFGMGDEPGLVGESRVGRIAVGGFVVASIVNSLVHLITLSVSATFGSGAWLLNAPVVLGTLALASLIAAAIVLVQRRALNPALRWGVVVVCAWVLLSQAIWYVPFFPTRPGAALTTIIAFAANGYFIGLLMQLVLGVGIALHGQAVALRRRAAIINDRW